MDRGFRRGSYSRSHRSHRRSSHRPGPSCSCRSPHGSSRYCYIPDSMESSWCPRTDTHLDCMYCWRAPQVNLMFRMQNEVAMRMQITIGSILGLSTLSICGAETINFDQARIGSIPAGWTIAMTHEGGAPKWEVVKDDSAPSKPNVLAQIST